MADYKATAAELASIANAIRLKGGTSAILEYPSEWITAIQNLVPSSGGSEISPLDPTAAYKVTDAELISIANAIRTKSGISSQLEFPVDFITAINSIPSPSPAPSPGTLEPFTATDVGGIGHNACGLFGSMAFESGIYIEFVGANSNNAMWNALNPDPITFHGYKHESAGSGADTYDYLIVDINDWLSAQSDFVNAFVQENNVQDNDSGTVTSPLNFNGIPAVDQFGPYLYSKPLKSYNIDVYASGNYDYSAIGITARIVAQGSRALFYSIDTGLQTAGGTKGYNSTGIYDLRLYFTGTGALACFKYESANIYNWDGASVGSTSPSSTIDWASNTVNTSVFNGWTSAKIKIPISISGLQTGWTADDFINALNSAWANGYGDQIVIENYTGPFPNE